MLPPSVQPSLQEGAPHHHKGTSKSANHSNALAQRLSKQPGNYIWLLLLIFLTGKYTLASKNELLTTPTPAQAVILIGILVNTSVSVGLVSVKARLG